MKSLSSKTYQCGVTIQGLTTLSGTVYLTGITNTASWDHVIVGTTAQGQLYTRTYAQLMSDITSGIGLSGYVPTSRTLTINGVSYDLTANRSWTISTVDYTSRLQHQVKAGVAINKGQAVYVTSADGTNMIVGLASNASEATSSKTMGLLDATVSTNGFANVVTEGLLAGLDTSAAGTEGDPVWLGTGGNLIYGLTNKPYAPAHLVFIGIVTRKNANNGEIFVKVQNGFELNEIHDVDLKTIVPVNGHILGFDGTLWVNKTIAGWLGYTPANASGTTNYLSKFTGSTTLGNSLVYDNGTNVGIGTTTPDSKLHIEGTTTGSGSGADAIVHIKQNGGWNGNEPWALYVEGYSYLNGFRVNAYDTQRSLFSSAGELGFAVSGNSPISFTQNTSDYRMYIAPGGNVGVGTTTPTYNLEVSSTGYTGFGVMSGANNNAEIGFQNRGYGLPRWTIRATGTPDGSSGNLTFQRLGGNFLLTLTSGENVLIGTTTDSGYKLDVNGSTRVKGTGTTSATTAFLVQNSTPANIFSVLDDGTAVFDLITSTSLVNIRRAGAPTSRKIELMANGGARFYTFDGEAAPNANGEDGAWLFKGRHRRAASSGIASAFKIEPFFVQEQFDTIQLNSIHIVPNINVSGTATNVTVRGIYYNPTLTSLTGTTHRAIETTSGDVIFNGGNVGIGTTSPGYKLDVVGSFNFVTSGVYLTYNSGVLYHGDYYQFPSGSYYYLYGRTGMGLIFGSNNAEVGRFDLSGNLGIGTTSPSAKLHTVGSGIVNIVQSSNTVSYTQYYNTSTGTNSTSDGLTVGLNGIDAYVFSREAGNLILGTLDTERVRITSAGLVGIGTSSPGAKLHVAGGEIRVDTGQAIMLDVTNTMYLVGASNQLRLYNGGNPVVNITTGGNVGIGTTSPNEKLHVAGNIHAYAAGGIDAGLFASTSAGSTSIAIRSNGVTHFNGGNVGIGTNSPNTKLTILGGDDASGTGVLELATGGGTNLKLGGNSTYSWIQSHSSKPLRINELGNSVIFNLGGGAVGIGTASPSTLLDVNGVITATGGNSTNWNTAYGWGNHSSAGYVPQARTLTINGTSYDLSANRSWTIATTTPGGSDTQFQYNSSGSLAGASALTYNSTTNRVGINQASPGYDFDVNGQVRVQDKLRVGTVNSGNGVVHMSSTATINPSATTIVWAQNVSVGMCAFIEYYILNDTSLTDQRAGTIMVTWNQSGTPTIAHTETTTPDIGSTTSINFTSSLVGADARINAVNSSANPYTIVMSYKYF